MSTIPNDATNMLECNEDMHNDNLHSTIYINCEDLQSINSNAMLTQFKLQVSDDIAFAVLNI